MADDVEVTERGEIVARCSAGAAWTEPHPDGIDVWLHVEDHDNSWIVASALVSRARLVAWCRRVLREVDPDPEPTVDEAAIRADERAKVEAEVLDRIEAHRRHARTAHLRHVRTVPGAAFTVPASGVDALDGLAEDIRAGKHRSTP